MPFPTRQHTNRLPSHILAHLRSAGGHQLHQRISTWCARCEGRRPFVPRKRTASGCFLIYTCSECHNPLYVALRSDYEPVLS